MLSDTNAAREREIYNEYNTETLLLRKIFVSYFVLIYILFQSQFKNETDKDPK